MFTIKEFNTTDTATRLMREYSKGRGPNRHWYKKYVQHVTQR